MGSHPGPRAPKHLTKCPVSPARGVSFCSTGDDNTDNTAVDLLPNWFLDFLLVGNRVSQCSLGWPGVCSRSFISCLWKCRVTGLHYHTWGPWFYIRYMYQSKFTGNKNHPIIPFHAVQVDGALGVLTNRTMKATISMEIKCFHWPQDILSGISVLSTSSHMTVPVDILLICLWYCHLFCRANGVLSCWAFLGFFVYIGSGTRSQGLSVHIKPTFRTQAKLQPPSDAESLLVCFNFNIFN